MSWPNAAVLIVLILTLGQVGTLGYLGMLEALPWQQRGYSGH